MPKENSDLSSGLFPGEEMAIQRLAKQIYESVCYHVCKNSGTEDDVPDVLQDTLIRVILNLRNGKVSPKADLKAYAIRIAKNVWYERLRLRKKEKLSPLNIEIHNPFDTSLEYIENKSAREFLFEAMTLAYDKLGKPCQELVQRTYWNKERLKDIAQEKGIKYNNLRFKMHYCMKKLRKMAHEIIVPKKSKP